MKSVKNNSMVQSNMSVLYQATVQRKFPCSLHEIPDWDGELASCPTPGNVNLAKRGTREFREGIGCLINLAQIVSICYQGHCVIGGESNLWEYKIRGISVTKRHPSILPYTSLPTFLHSTATKPQWGDRHSLWQTRISNPLPKWSLPR